MNPPLPSIVDTAHAVVQELAAALSGRLVAAYLIGSGADGTTVALSDIDLIVVLDTPLGDDAARAAATARAACVSATAELRLDLGFATITEVSTLHAVIQVALKRESLLLWGVDLRPHLRLPPLDAYTSDVTDGAWHFLARILRGTELPALPLAAPAPDDPLLGYTQVRVAPWYAPDTPTGTKEFVATATRIATALLAIEYGGYAGSKRSAVEQYAQQAASTPWATFPQVVYERCKLDWAYQVPMDAVGHAELRTLCAAMLAFERWYMTAYAAYLNRLVMHDDGSVRAWARERHSRIGVLASEVASTSTTDAL